MAAAPIDYALQLKAQRLADLLASVRVGAPQGQVPGDPVIVNPLDGITSGPGNQGSANQAHMAGHAGTGAGQWSVPRQLKIGQSGTKLT